MGHPLATVLILSLFSSTALGAACSATSPPHRVPLLELYTSEGCDSCPPADAWVKSLRARNYAGHRVVVLAFHVDYWDRLGWPDRFAQQRFSERQRIINSRIGSRVVYTPQLVLNGRDYRRGARDDFVDRVAAIGREPPRAALTVMISASEKEWSVAGNWSGAETRGGHGWLALYENDLATDVRAGENRGKRLQHDFVVRDLAGPFPSGEFTHVFKIDPVWKRRDLFIAGFVQDARSGDVLQALALTACSSPGG